MATIKDFEKMERASLREVRSVFGPSLKKAATFKRPHNISNEGIPVTRVPSWRSYEAKADDAMPPSKRAGARKSPGRPARKLDLSLARPKEASYRISDQMTRPSPLSHRKKSLASVCSTDAVAPRSHLPNHPSTRSWKEHRPVKEAGTAPTSSAISDSVPVIDQSEWQAKLAAFQKNQQCEYDHSGEHGPKSGASEDSVPPISGKPAQRSPLSAIPRSPGKSPTRQSRPGVAKISSLKTLLRSPTNRSSATSTGSSLSLCSSTPLSPLKSDKKPKLRLKVKLRSAPALATPRDVIKERAATKMQSCWRRYRQRKLFLSLIADQRRINKLRKKLANVERKKTRDLEEIAKVVQEYKDSADAKAQRRRDAMALRAKQNSAAEKIVEELKRDNAEIGSKNDALLQNIRNLRINNMRLEKSSESSKEYFDQLQLHHSRCVEDNQKLSKVEANYKNKAAELQENLNTRSRYHNAEHRIRALYRKTIQKVVNAVEETNDESLILRLYELQGKMDILEKEWTDPEPLSPTSASVKKKFKLSMKANAPMKGKSARLLSKASTANILDG